MRLILSFPLLGISYPKEFQKLILGNFFLFLFFGGGAGRGWRLYHVVCRISVPQPGLEPRAMTVKARSPNHWTARESPNIWKLQEVLFLWFYSIVPDQISESNRAFSQNFSKRQTNQKWSEALHESQGQMTFLGFRFILGHSSTRVVSSKTFLFKNSFKFTSGATYDLNPPNDQIHITSNLVYSNMKHWYAHTTIRIKTSKQKPGIPTSQSLGIGPESYQEGRKSSAIIMMPA